jgi:DNA-binding transcriptional MerR regulator
MATEPGYRGPNVCSIVGITYRQLDYWARTDLLKPSLADAKGSGTQRLYSYTDLLKLKVIKRLLDEGLSLQKARSAIRALEETGNSPTTASLVLNGPNSLLVSTDGQILDLLKGGQGVLNIVPLAGVVEELNAAIHELKPKETEVETEATPAAGTEAEGGSEGKAEAPPRAGTGG